MPPGGAEVDIAVLFADVRGSTSLGEHLTASEFAALLHRFYHEAAGVLMAHDAIIDKLIGDEVMALFISGYCGPAYRQRAVDAASALIHAAGYGAATMPWLPLAVGVHAGPAFVGNVGGAGVTDFTALGDTVNTAARLQAVARAGEIVLSEAIYQSVQDRYPELQSRIVTLRGKQNALTIRMLRSADEVEQ